LHLHIENLAAGPAPRSTMTCKTMARIIAESYSELQWVATERTGWSLTGAVFMGPAVGLGVDLDRPYLSCRECALSIGANTRN